MAHRFLPGTCEWTPDQVRGYGFRWGQTSTVAPDLIRSLLAGETGVGLGESGDGVSAGGESAVRWLVSFCWGNASGPRIKSGDTGDEGGTPPRPSPSRGGRRGAAGGDGQFHLPLVGRSVRAHRVGVLRCGGAEAFAGTKRVGPGSGPGRRRNNLYYSAAALSRVALEMGSGLPSSAPGASRPR